VLRRTGGEGCEGLSIDTLIDGSVDLVALQVSSAIVVRAFLPEELNLSSAVGGGVESEEIAGGAGGSIINGGCRVGNGIGRSIPAILGPDTVVEHVTGAHILVLKERVAILYGTHAVHRGSVGINRAENLVELYIIRSRAIVRRQSPGDSDRRALVSRIIRGQDTLWGAWGDVIQRPPGSRAGILRLNGARQGGNLVIVQNARRQAAIAEFGYSSPCCVKWRVRAFQYRVSLYDIAGDLTARSIHR